MIDRNSRCRWALVSFSLLLICIPPSTHTLSASSDGEDGALQTIRPEALRADMRFLSDDLLEGRGTGTRGHEIAARFVASEFEKTGLEPAGENGTYFQSVPLRSIQVDNQQTTLSISRTGKEQELTLGRISWPLVTPHGLRRSLRRP